MFGRKSNFINGDWVEGEGEIININPSDTNDIIDKNSNATSNQLSDAINDFCLKKKIQKCYKMLLFPKNLGHFPNDVKKNVVLSNPVHFDFIKTIHG